MRTRPFRTARLAAAAIPFVLLRCIPYEYTSRWLDRAITVDGSDGDWQGATVYVEKANVSIGMFNDSESMYICMVTTDRQIARRTLREGMRLWFDPEGGQKKTFGIRFPAGYPEGDPKPGGTAGEFPGLDSESSNFAFFAPQTDLEILGPGKDDMERMPVDDAGGIRARTAVDSGRFVYELKVPLVTSEGTPHAVGIKSKKQVTVGFEVKDSSPADERGRGPGMRGRGMSPGGMGGGPGMAGGQGMDDAPGMGGPGMDPAGGNRLTEKKQISLWILVKLASPVSPGGR